MLYQAEPLPDMLEIGARNIVNLVGCGPKDQRVHDGRHVARSAAAAGRLGGVVSMLGDAPLDLRMTLQTHPIGISAELEGVAIRAARIRRAACSAAKLMPVVL